MLYTKYFYGFEKEGATVAYRDGKATQGHYFNYRYPILESAINQTLVKALNIPIKDVSFLLPKPQHEIEKEKQAQLELEARIAAMDTKEKRRYDAEQRRQERLKADLESERLLKEQMDFTKRLVASVQPDNDNIVIERLRGLVKLESGDTS